ncbi:MAG: tetratricopeptide repeat protein [Alphaproteobacteria bacterium]
MNFRFDTGFRSFSSAIVAAAIALCAATTDARAQAAGEASNTELQKALESASPDTALAVAQKAITEGRYEQAVGILTGLLLGDPENASLKLLIGDLYSRMGSFAQARTYVEGALESNTLSADETQNAQTILALMGGGKPVRDVFSLSGRISSGLRYRTNATGGTTSAVVIINDQVVASNNNAEKESDTDWYLSGSARAVYVLDPESKLNMDTRAFMLARKQFAETQNDLIVGEASPGLSIPLIVSQSYVMQGRGYGILGFADLDGELAQTVYGAGGELRHQLGKRLQLTQSLEFREVDYRAITGRATIEELDGSETRLTLGARYLLTEDLVAGLDYRLGDRDTVTIDQDREQHRIGSNLTYSYDTPFELSSNSSRIRGGVSYVATNFENPDRTLSAVTEREDREWRLDLSNNLAFRDNMTFDVAVSHSERSSSLPNFETDNTSLSVGLSLNF